MKRIIYLLLILALTTPSIALATTLDGRYTREKKQSKSYQVNSDTQLYIENKYGNVEISPWDRDEISIEVIIRTTGNNESKVEDKLDEINISFSGNKSIVRAKTHIESSSSWFNWFSSNVNYKINYHIRVPISNDLNITNKYGDTFIEESTGVVKLSHDYGSIIIGNLTNERNEIDMDYSKLEADYIKNATITIDYTDISIDEIETIDLDSDYSDVNLGKVINATYDMDYGSISINAVNKINGNSDYTDIEIDLLGKTATLSADYGKMSIGGISTAFESISIDTDYTGIKIGYFEDSNFSFDINSKYTDVDGLDDDLFNLNFSNKKSSSSQYKGTYGRSQSNGLLEIKSTYGHLKFRKK